MIIYDVLNFIFIVIEASGIMKHFHLMIKQNPTIALQYTYNIIFKICDYEILIYP